MDFERMPKIPRMGNARDMMVITEKIDGTNAQVMIDEDYNVTACSKRRTLTLDNDNYGFCRWVHENEEDLKDILGPGRHYGEWWGSGIQRKYLCTNGDKYFSIFNTKRPADSLREPVSQVPVLHVGPFDTNQIYKTADELLEHGSYLCPEQYFKPEGIVVCNIPTGQLWKITYDYKEGKWAAQ